MRVFTKLTTVVALIILGSYATAGGLSPEIMETPQVADDVLAPATSSINSTYIILGILAALLIAAAINADDDDDDEEDAAPAAADEVVLR